MSYSSILNDAGPRLLVVHVHIFVVHGMDRTCLKPTCSIQIIYILGWTTTSKKSLGATLPPSLLWDHWMGLCSEISKVGWQARDTWTRSPSAQVKTDDAFLRRVENWSLTADHRSLRRRDHKKHIAKGCKRTKNHWVPGSWLFGQRCSSCEMQWSTFGPPVRRNGEWLPWDVTHPTGTTQRRPRQSQFQPPRDKNATKIAAKALSAAVKGPAMASIWAWSTWYELIRSHPYWIIGSHEL